MELASAGLVCVCVAGWERRAFGGEQAYRSAWTAASLLVLKPALRI